MTQQTIDAYLSSTQSALKELMDYFPTIEKTRPHVAKAVMIEIDRLVAEVDLILQRAATFGRNSLVVENGRAVLTHAARVRLNCEPIA